MVSASVCEWRQLASDAEFADSDGCQEILTGGEIEIVHGFRALSNYNHWTQ
jgi:hypothetical protein